MEAVWLFDRLRWNRKFCQTKQECAALQAAGAIGHVVGQKCIAKAVQFANFFRLVMRGSHEWQAAVAKLFKTGFEK